MLKVIVADNHPIVLFGIKSMLERQEIPQVIVDGATTSALFDILSQEQPDLLVLELDIPECNGIAALRRVKKDHPDLKVLIYSGQSEDVYALSTIRAGASGYLCKHADRDKFIRAIEKIGSGGIFITNELAQRLAFDESTQKPRRFFRKLSTRVLARDIRRFSSWSTAGSASISVSNTGVRSIHCDRTLACCSFSQNM